MVLLLACEPPQPALPPISSGECKWKHQAEILRSAAQFQTDGGKLIRLEFPRTETQRFGDVAILYSKYIVETEMHDKHSVSSGRATEILCYGMANGPIPVGTQMGRSDSRQ